MKKTKLKVEPKLISYTLSASINTAQYENIQPTITVEAESIQEAHDFLFPYFAKLFKDYSVHSKNNPETTTTNVEVKIPKNITSKYGDQLEKFSEPAKKALSAIMATNNKKALVQLKDKVQQSVRIPDSEKVVLLKIISEQ